MARWFGGGDHAGETDNRRLPTSRPTHRSSTLASRGLLHQHHLPLVSPACRSRMLPGRRQARHRHLQVTGLPIGRRKLVRPDKPPAQTERTLQRHTVSHLNQTLTS